MGKIQLQHWMMRVLCQVVTQSDNTSCCDKNLHAAQEIPLRDHEAQRVQTKSQGPHFYEKPMRNVTLNQSWQHHSGNKQKQRK